MPATQDLHRLVRTGRAHDLDLALSGSDENALDEVTQR
jgi:hypothetical protein